MRIEVIKKIGSSQFKFEVDEPKEVEALAKAGMLASAPERCELCKGEVTLNGKKAKGYTFVEIRCKECGATASLGQYKEGGFFWKRFEKYQPEARVADDDNIPVIDSE
jgi:hypothetical protein